MASASSFNATLAVLLAAKYCRQYPLFHWREEALPSMGQRAEKYCFRVDLVNLQHEKSGEMLLALLPSEVSLLDFKKETTLYRLKALLVTLKVGTRASSLPSSLLLMPLCLAFLASIHSSSPRHVLFTQEEGVALGPAICVAWEPQGSDLPGQ